MSKRDFLSLEDWSVAEVDALLELAARVKRGSVTGGLERKVLAMVLEGVHLVPGMLSTDLENALVVQCVLAIHDEEVHRTHFLIRDVDSDGVRPGDKYVAGLPEIRMIQEYVVERARRLGLADRDEMLEPAPFRLAFDAKTAKAFRSHSKFLRLRST